MVRKSIGFIAVALCMTAISVAQLAAQEVETEGEEIVETKSGYNSSIDCYISGQLLSADEMVDNQLGANLPDYGFGIGFRTVSGYGWFRSSTNFGFAFSGESWKYAPEDPLVHNPRDVQTTSLSFYLDFTLGAGFYFTENQRYGMDVLAGIGFDYSGLFVYKGKPNKAVYYDYSIGQGSFYVPVSLRFKLNDYSITATYRYSFSQFGTTIIDSKDVDMDRDAAIRLTPLEIAIGFSF